MAVAPPAAAADLTHHDITLTLTPDEHRLAGRDRITWQGGGRLTFALHPAITPSEVRVDGRPYAVEEASATGRWRGSRHLESGRHRVTVRFRGTLAPDRARPGFREVLKGFPPRIGPEGTYLPAGTAWLPDLGETTVTYRLRVTAPPGHLLAAAGQRSARQRADGRRTVTFDYARPIQGITLLGGPYTRHRGPGSAPVATSALLHPELADLADDYLKAAEGFLNRYQARIGPYPHYRFQLVSSPWPTGFGFPGMAYIGRRILPLPFISRTSLPHEVLHNWWGNGVFVAADSGNWAEGLTTFGADYRLARARSAVAAREQRRQWLVDYASYHDGSEPPPLREFRARIDGASRTLGYNKAAFVWIMLERRLGKAPFRAGLRRFYSKHRGREATWEDLRHAFEAESGQDLEGFFGQWLDRSDAPRPELVAVSPGGDRVELTLTQPESPYRLRLPVRLTFADGTVTEHTVRLENSRRTFSLPAAPRAALEKLQVDPAFRVFRRLAPAAVPPQVAVTLAREAGAVWLHPELDSAPGRRAARKVASGLWGDDRVALAASRDAAVRVVPLADLAGHWARFFGNRQLPEWPAGTEAAVVMGRPGPESEAAMLVGVTDARALEALARPLPHYGGYGWLAFAAGERLGRGRWPVREAALTWRAEGHGPVQR
jgi:hypothetical protein